MTSTATGLIRVSKAPCGTAPYNIRQAWVGLELPCEPVMGFTGEPHKHANGKPAPDSYGFCVPQAEALEILEHLHPHEALWWKQHGFPQDGKYFHFQEDEAEIIRGVTRQVMRVPDDDAWGNTER